VRKVEFGHEGVDAVEYDDSWSLNIGMRLRFTAARFLGKVFKNDGVGIGCNQFQFSQDRVDVNEGVGEQVLEIIGEGIAAFRSRGFILLGDSREFRIGVFLAESDSIVFSHGETAAHGKESLKTGGQALVVGGLCVENGRKVHLLDTVPLGKIAVLGTCGFFELDESLVGQDQDILDFFCSSVPEK